MAAGHRRSRWLGLLTLRALELEEPEPHRPASDVLCRRSGTPRLGPHRAKSWVRHEHTRVCRWCRTIDRIRQTDCDASWFRGDIDRQSERLCCTGLHTSAWLAPSRRMGPLARETPHTPFASLRPRVIASTTLLDLHGLVRRNRRLATHESAGQRCYRSVTASHVVKDPHPMSASADRRPESQRSELTNSRPEFHFGWLHQDRRALHTCSRYRSQPLPPAKLQGRNPRARDDTISAS